MSEGLVIVIDDHAGVRRSVCALLRAARFSVKDYETAEAFLADGAPDPTACLVVDIRLPGMSGLDLQKELNHRRWRNPVIVVSGHADVPTAVQAIKAGAVDLLEKPFDDEVLLDNVRRALEAAQRGVAEMPAPKAVELVASLTRREKEVLDRLVLGESNKMIAGKLDISVRTVEIHRQHIQQKLNARNLSDLIRFVRIAGPVD